MDTTCGYLCHLDNPIARLIFRVLFLKYIVGILPRSHGIVEAANPRTYLRQTNERTHRKVHCEDRVDKNAMPLAIDDVVVHEGFCHRESLRFLR